MTADDWGWTCIRHNARGRGDGCPLCKRDAAVDGAQLRAEIAAQTLALVAQQEQIVALSRQVAELTRQMEQARRLLAATNVRLG